MTTLGNWGSLYCHLRAVTCLCAQPAWPFVLPHPFHLSLSCGRGLYGGKFHDHLILNCAKSGAWIGVWLLLPFFGELLIYLFLVWEALEPFYLLTVLLLPKPLTVQRLDRNPLSSMLLEIFNCFCAIVKHHNFVFYHCAESQRYLRAEEEMLGNCCKKPGRSTESFQLSFLTKVALWAEGLLWLKGLQIQKAVDQPFMSCRAWWDQDRLQQLFSPFKCALRALGLCGCRRQTHSPSGMWWECAGRGTWPFPFLPTPPHSWAHPAQWMGFLLTEQSRRGFLIFLISLLLVMKQML